MENTEKINPQEIQIQGLLDSFLKLPAKNNDLSNENRHLDEDLLSAFVEGNLSRRESPPIISHLVECSFCRQNTAELVRLEMAFANEEIPALETQVEQPTKVSEVLNDLLSRIFGTNDASVFAHQESEEKEKEEIKEEKVKGKK